MEAHATFGKTWLERFTAAAGLKRTAVVEFWAAVPREPLPELPDTFHPIGGYGQDRPEFSGDAP
jgi:hypothetical protein